MNTVLASNNVKKLKELQHLLRNSNLNIISQKELQVTPVPETGLTYVENAIIKARNVCRQTGFASIADDSGLEVDALKGAPGVYSARYAGALANDEDNIYKLLDAMVKVEEIKRSARFRCVIVYMREANDPAPIICEGVWQGKILMRPQGKNGFGYDPIFFVPTHNCASAELSSKVKDQISHRGQAIHILVNLLRNMKSVV